MSIKYIKYKGRLITIIKRKKDNIRNFNIFIE